MSYQFSRMNSILTMNIIIVLVNSQSTPAARMCYVCGKGSEEPFQQDSKTKLEHLNMDIPLSCDEFESSNNLDKFIFTCPSTYVGCITQSDGTDVTRTCDSLPINDCQTANGVEYCYCSTDLCNKKKDIIPIKSKHETFYDDDDTSDMDEFVSSGYRSIDTILDETMETTISTSSAIPKINSSSLPPAPVLTKITTVTTTTEAISGNKDFTAVSYNQSDTFPTTTAGSTAAATTTTNNATDFVKRSKIIFIMQLLLMLIYPVAILS